MTRTKAQAQAAHVAKLVGRGLTEKGTARMADVLTIKHDPKGVVCTPITGGGMAVDVMPSGFGIVAHGPDELAQAKRTAHLYSLAEELRDMLRFEEAFSAYYADPSPQTRAAIYELADALGYAFDSTAIPLFICQKRRELLTKLAEGGAA